MSNANEIRNSHSKYVVSLHQLATFEEYLLKVPEEDINEIGQDLVALNACLLGMHPILMEQGEFIN